MKKKDSITYANIRLTGSAPCREKGPSSPRSSYKNKAVLLGLAVLLGALLLAGMAAGFGCAPAPTPAPSEPQESAPPDPADPADPTGADEAPFAVLIDQKGRDAVIPTRPESLISLSPSKTEIAFALGLEDRIVGVTDYCNYPPAAAEVKKVGGFADPNIEQIVALAPDLVLASSLHQEQVEKLEELGINVLVLYANSVEDIYRGLEMVGEATGNQAQAAELVQSMEARLQAVQSHLDEADIPDPVRVYHEVYSDPLMSAGGSTIIHQVITLAGGENIFGDVREDYPVVSAEAILESEPQVILFPLYHGTAEFMIEEMKQRPGWADLPAVQQERIYGVHDDIFSRPGPRVVEAVEMAAEIFYPNLF